MLTAKTFPYGVLDNISVNKNVLRFQLLKTIGVFRINGQKTTQNQFLLENFFSFYERIT